MELAAADVDAASLEERYGTSVVTARDSSGLLIYERDFGDPSNLNSARQPFFARVDTRLTFWPRGDEGRWLVYLDLLNALGRRNTLFVNPAVVGDAGADRPRIKEERVPSVRLFPSLGVRFRF